MSDVSSSQETHHGSVAPTEVDAVIGQSPELTVEQEAELIDAANAHKAKANALYNKGQHDAALTAYEDAVAVLPAGQRHSYDLAVLRSNMAACHLRASAWKEAAAAATLALDALQIMEKQQREKQDSIWDEEATSGRKEEEEADEEIVSVGAAKAAKSMPVDKHSAATCDPDRIRAKALLRRARARSALGGWSDLSGAQEDFQVLMVMAKEAEATGTAAQAALTAKDWKLVQMQLRDLPARTKVAQEKEMSEMWGKLKELGNGILRPFGMSTDNFQMVQDEKTGGYSMNFRPNGQ